MFRKRRVAAPRLGAIFFAALLGVGVLGPALPARADLLDVFFASRHPGGAQFALVDGSVHFLSETIQFDVYEDLATVAGGEVNRWSP